MEISDFIIEQESDEDSNCSSMIIEEKITDKDLEEEFKDTDLLEQMKDIDKK